MSQSRMEQMKKATLGLDDSFRFGCKMCGKCCTHRYDIVLSPMDIHRMCGILRVPPAMFYRDNCVTTIGSSSHLPVTRLRPVGPDDHCPLLKDHLCSVHAGKPASCALFPLGRYVDKGEVKYFVQPITCGDGSSRQTVREWLSGFNIEAEDKIYARWGEMITALREKMIALEESCDVDTVQLAHRVVLLMMFLEYNQHQDFTYQLEANFENTMLLLSDPAKLWAFARGEM